MLKLFFDPKIYRSPEEVYLAGVLTPEGKPPVPGSLEGYLKTRLTRLIQQAEQEGVNLHQAVQDYLGQEGWSDRPEEMADSLLSMSPFPSLLPELEDRLRRPPAQASPLTQEEVQGTFDEMTFSELLAMMP